jgi:hypothetical protein
VAQFPPQARPHDGAATVDRVKSGVKALVRQARGLCRMTHSDAKRECKGGADDRHVNLRMTIDADRLRTGRREINDPVLDVGTAVIDPHHRAKPVTLVRYAHEHTERQRLVGGSQGARVDVLAIGQWAAAVGIRRPVDRRNLGLGMHRVCNTTRHERGNKRTARTKSGLKNTSFLVRPAHRPAPRAA